MLNCVGPYSAVFVVVHIGSTHADGIDAHEDLASARLGDRSLLDGDIPDPAKHADPHVPARCGTAHFTAPRDRPCTSLSWAAKPAMRTGRETTSEAAQTLARNKPWLVTKPVRKTGAVWALVAVRTRANSSSFQLKMKQISDVAAMPGMTPGATPWRRIRGRLAPSIAAASSISTGTSARNERIIQTAIGRFIAV